MAKTILGVDIGYDSLKLALVNGLHVKKTCQVPMPKNLVKEGRVVSPETMGELIRNTMKENGIRANRAALVLPNETVFIRNVTMPQMTADQLAYNLPFEFRDYITDELKNYVFDYAMVTTPAEMNAQPVDENGNPLPKTMDLMAVSAPLSLIEESRDMLRKAGLKLVKAAPSVCAFQSLIRQMEKTGETYYEYGILDLGYQSIRLYMYRGDRHIVTRVLEIGMSSLDQVIADAYNVDIHLAHTYLLTNHEFCQSAPFCETAYGNIAVELLRAVNFYRFSNPESQLTDIWLCGGGAVISPLQNAIADTLGMRIHQASELMPFVERLEDSHTMAQVIGITMD